ncbi:PREDICTED: nucleoporin Nup43 [Nicrophorus vespilloides]|uniref:Nucleoporin Nup43 n=1 Tax=Nicrophorus vespilloides TaxID=110193 RepID=A0ABM1MQ11_NICVS|nr:PREDICTED: nucleoporin Nup43 [Nicrophorus vespilloides]
MGRNIHCTYISEKINKIRWRPNPFNDPKQFVTGSWDNDENHIRLWEVKGFEEDTDINPFEINVLPFDGDVTELKCVNPDYLIATSNEGKVYLIKIATNITEEICLSHEIVWDDAHQGMPCTSFAVYDKDIATVGEDGRINLLSIMNKAPTRVIDDADSCTVNCVEFLKFNELITGNSRGQMKIWDLRADEEKASQIFMLSGDSIVAATCLAQHPTQRHLTAAGDEHGSITLWDLRQNTYPLNVMTSHTESVTEVQFHPDRPEHIFSCGQAGDVFHWSGIKQGACEESAWYTSTTNKYDIFMLMPQLHTTINSIDLNRDRLLCGSDNEAMYMIEGVNIYS